jgi:hypothetical protein
VPSRCSASPAPTGNWIGLFRIPWQEGLQITVTGEVFLEAPPGSPSASEIIIRKAKLH